MYPRGSSQTLAGFDNLYAMQQLPRPVFIRDSAISLLLYNRPDLLS